jgi:hypothetical protein
LFDEEEEEERFKGGGSLLDDKGLVGSKVEVVQQEGFVGSTTAMDRCRHIELQYNKTCHLYLTVKRDFPFIIILQWLPGASCIYIFIV